MGPKLNIRSHAFNNIGKTFEIISFESGDQDGAIEAII
jgi:hypothetical protein